MTFGQGGIALWLYELKQKNINEFMYRDLPKELQLKRMILKAKFRINNKDKKR